MLKNIYNLYREYCSKRKEESKRLRKISSPDTKPLVINFNATEICNSACSMCNIWKNSQSMELSPPEMENLLKDDLFSEVMHVGVTGGEPTLRKDLPDIFQAIINALPQLKGLSMITNCIDHTNVIKNISEIKRLCDRQNISFQTMISIDGVGKVHDKVRGIKGNFESTRKVMEWLKSNNIDFSFGATISKINVWDIEELLFFAKKNNLYGRFRIAEFINRLNNSDKTNIIRNFNDDEKYQLWLFFQKLIVTFEQNRTFQNTYKSIQNVLMGGERTISCPYQTNGIVFNSKGELSYCAPKSSIIGNAKNSPAIEIYRDNIMERKNIFTENCKNCIHDYHSSPLFSTYKQALKSQFSLRLAKDTRWRYIRPILPFISKAPKSKNYSVFIIGWYGTETVGDKAILASIINDYKTKHPNCNIIIGSLYPTVTEKTCKELGIDAKVVNSQSFDLIKFAISADETVMGGGPLMALNELYVPLRAFEAAKIANKKTAIYGCGLGPLHKKTDTIKAIVSIADEVTLRDNASLSLANKWFPQKKAVCIGDPAEKYVSSRTLEIAPAPKEEIACFLRELTFEYRHNGEDEEAFHKRKVELEQKIALSIKGYAEKMKIDRIRFYHMHNFVIGGDDRDFSRYFIDSYFPDDQRVSYDKKLSTVDSIIKAMKSSRLNICMRFHSVLFAETLNTDYIAIDYTKGGKIHHFLNDKNKLHKICDLNK